MCDWQQAGVWDLIHFALLDWLARDGQLGWSRAVVDCCSIRAVYVGEQTGPNPTDRAKRGSKPSDLRRAWRAACGASDRGESERPAGSPRVGGCDSPLHGARGRPRQRPDCVLGNRGYDAAAIRRGLRARHNEPWVAMRRQARERPAPVALGRRAYLCLAESIRRLSVRYDKRADIRSIPLARVRADLRAVAAQDVENRLKADAIFPRRPSTNSPGFCQNRVHAAAWRPSGGGRPWTSVYTWPSAGSNPYRAALVLTMQLFGARQGVK